MKLFAWHHNRISVFPPLTRLLATVLLTGLGALATLDPGYPRTLDDITRQSMSLTSRRADDVIPNPGRWNLMMRGEDSGPGGGESPVSLANVSGFPDMIVPAGFTGRGLPVTISFLGTAFSEPRLLALGYAFEQLTRARRLPAPTPVLNNELISYQLWNR